MNIKRLLTILVCVSILIPSFQVLANVSTKVMPTGISLVSSSQEEIILEFVAPPYSIESIQLNRNSYSKIVLPGAASLSEASKPDLPVFSTLISIPPNAQMSVRVLESKTQTLDGSFKIAPGGTPAPLEDDLQPGEWLYLEDPIVYQQRAMFPQESVRGSDAGYLRDHHLGRVEIFPFQYHPADGRLVFHSSLRIQIRFWYPQEINNQPIMQLDSNRKNTQGTTDPFTAIIKNQVINPASIDAWQGVPSSLLAQPSASPQFSSSSNPRYKISVWDTGIYQLSYADLEAAGMNMATVDPSTFAMSNQGRDVAIYVSNSDGNEHVFSPGEYVLFFGEKFTGDYMASLYSSENARWRSFIRQLPNGTYTTWKPQFNATMVEKYTTENVYWLEEGDDPGSKMNSVDGTPGSATTPQTYRETRRYEESHIWKTTHFTGEDTWFWDDVKVSIPATIITRSYTMTIDALPIGSFTAQLRGEMVAYAGRDGYDPPNYYDHRAIFYINRSTNPGGILDGLWDGKSRYTYEIGFNQNQFSPGLNLIDIDFYRQSHITSEGIYFDWFEVEYDRLFQASNDRLDFTSNQAGSWKYQINGFTTSSPMILDISNPLSPTIVENSTFVSNVLSFEVTHGAGARFFTGRPTAVAALDINQYSPPDITQAADYVYITHADFITATQALETYRNNQGYTTLVVDFEDLVNQYNYGIYHPIAIKNFLADTLNLWGSLPEYVLLVGDGHWNFHQYSGYDAPQIYLPPNLNWVDPWQGEVDSANLYVTLVGNDPLPDIMIGHLPVNEVNQIYQYLTKIQHHEQTTGEGWMKRFIFVADDTPDSAGDFVKYSEDMIKNYFLNPIYTADRQYLDTYKDTGTCGPSSGRHNCQAATDALIATLNTNGASIINYIGHASINIWASEGILVNEDVGSLTNGNHLPILLSMTCLDGYWSHPNMAIASKSGQGLVEELVRANNRGVVAAFSPTGLGVSTGHDFLHRGFYDRVFSGATWTLGEAATQAKTKLYSYRPVYEDLLHTFTIFGDPALQSVAYERYLVFLPLLNR